MHDKELSGEVKSRTLTIKKRAVKQMERVSFQVNEVARVNKVAHKPAEKPGESHCAAQPPLPWQSVLLLLAQKIQILLSLLCVCFFSSFSKVPVLAANRHWR